jgi:hypothetical protein
MAIKPQLPAPLSEHTAEDNPTSMPPFLKYEQNMKGKSLCYKDTVVLKPDVLARK